MTGIGMPTSQRRMPLIFISITAVALVLHANFFIYGLKQLEVANCSMTKGICWR